MTEIGQVAIAVAFLAAIPPTLVGLAALRTSRQNAAKADKLITKADEIHVSTNGNLSAVREDLTAANRKIDSLEKLVGELAKKLSERSAKMRH